MTSLRRIDPETITVHGRIALALLAAEHVAPLLAGLPDVRRAVDDALRDDWGWMERRNPDPSRLYWDHMPRIMELDSALAEDDPRLPILHCALYAHSYAIWSAEGATNLEAPGTVLSIGNDIAEVDESYLSNCLESAIRVSPAPDATAAWLDDLVARMEREQPKTADDVLGPRLRRHDFDVPELPDAGP